jgi:hypothetical protein
MAARDQIEFEETLVWPGQHALLPAGTAQELGRKITEEEKPMPRPFRREVSR